MTPSRGLNCHYWRGSLVTCHVGACLSLQALCGPKQGKNSTQRTRTSTPDDLENPKARSASDAAIALRQTMQVLQKRASQHVAGQREAAADCGVRPRSRCRIPVVVTKLPACNSLRAPRSAPCSVRATPTSSPIALSKLYNMNRPMAVALEPQTPQIRC